MTPFLTQTGFMLGTPHYVSPEQALGKQVDFRGDVYSLGIVLYEMLTAERPFRGTTPMAVVAQNLHEPLPDVRQKRPDIPDQVVSLLEAMTRKDPQERPGSYEELGIGIRAEPDTGPTVPFPRGKRSIAFPWIVAAGIALGVILGVVLHYAIEPTASPPPADSPASEKLVVAVAPFWGPDDVSAREGRVMATLVERSIESRLGDQVEVAGIDQTGEAIRSHEKARELGSRLGAGVVVWGEALSLRSETELQPSFTLVDFRPAAPETNASDSPAPSMRDFDVMDVDAEREAQPLKLSADAPDQIELRRMSAEGVGEMATFLAGLYHLHVRNEPEMALRLFEQSVPSADVLRYQAEALVRLDRPDEAREVVRRAIEVDPDHAAARAQLADFLWQSGEREEALEHYRRAAASGRPVEAVQAILHDDRLFVRELWVNDSGETRDSGYLLVVDPDADRVLERHFLPGEIVKMRSGPEELEIIWSERGVTGLQTLVWRDDGFTTPLYAGGNLLRRMNGVKSGAEVGRNFTTGVSGRLETQEANPTYGLPDDPDQINRAKPSSFEELESFLLQSIERDPTQPWYPVHLGFVQKATGREAGAEQTWTALFDREWPGVPYWEFTWIARLYERLGEHAWADKAFETALEIRKSNPQPVVWTYLLDRMIVAPFVRMHESALADPGRAYEWLVRARELTGTTEGTRLAASVWSSYFAEMGDGARSDDEAALRDTAFDWTVRSATGDYLLYPLLTLLLGLPVFTLMLGSVAWRRARATPRPGEVPADSRATRIAIATGLLLMAAAATSWALLLPEASVAWKTALWSLILFWILLVVWLFRREIDRGSTKWFYPVR